MLSRIQSDGLQTIFVEEGLDRAPHTLFGQGRNLLGKLGSFLYYDLSPEFYTRPAAICETIYDACCVCVSRCEAVALEGDTSAKARVRNLGIEDGSEREGPRCTEMNLEHNSVG